MNQVSIHLKLTQHCKLIIPHLKKMSSCFASNWIPSQASLPKRSSESSYWSEKVQQVLGTVFQVFLGCISGWWVVYLLYFIFYTNNCTY